jgi:hypothetical protein
LGRVVDVEVGGIRVVNARKGDEDRVKGVGEEEVVKGWEDLCGAA